MTDKRLVNVDRANELHNKPFRLTASAIKEGKVSFREEFRTGFHFNTTRVKTGLDQHKIGFINEEGKFMTRLRYKGGDTFKVDDYGAYTYTHPETQKPTNYFEKKYIAEVEFTKPETFMVWNKDSRKEVPQEFDGAYIAISWGLVKKLTEAMDDPRNNMYDYYIISYTAKAAPANMYSIKWHSPGKPLTETTATPAQVITPTQPAPVVATPAQTRPKVFPHEAALLADVKGDAATKEVLIEYLKHEAQTKGVTMTPERIAIVAETVLVNGIVTV